MISRRLTLSTAGALLMCAALTIGPAAAASEPTIEVAGRALDGSKIAASVLVTGVTADLNEVTEVRWELDGAYVGRAVKAPFDLRLRTDPGQHRLKARFTIRGNYHRTDARFTVLAATAEPTPTVPPAPPSSPGSTRVVTVRTSTELHSALRNAKPGLIISLADGTYRGNFLATASGTSSAPIVLRGTRSAVLDGGSFSTGYALHLEGANHWRLEGFRVTGAKKGVILDHSSFNELRALDIGRTGEEAVHLRAASNDNLVTGCDVHDTGLTSPGFGEGVYVGSAKSHWKDYSSGSPDRSDRNKVIGNRIHDTTAESIDIKEGTTGGLIQGNTFDGSTISGENYADSWLDLKGNNYRVVSNTGTSAPLDGFQTHVVVEGWGRGNVFSANTLRVNGTGYGINIDEVSSTKNLIACNNIVHSAGKGLSNTSCS